MKQNSLVIPLERSVARAAPGLIVCASCHYGHTKPDTGASPAPTRQAALR
jgi:hypothetical protein